MLNRLLLSFCVLSLAVMPARAQLRDAVDTRALTLPGVGETTLRVLSPTILEITRISASLPPASNARAGAAAVLGSPLAAAGRMQVQVGGRPVAVAGSGWKRRALYAPLNKKDPRIATSLYLRLAQPIAAEGAPPTVQVTDGSGAFIPASVRLTAPFDPNRASPALHVNQEGYVPSLPKKAMVGYYLGDMGELDVGAAREFTVVDARSGQEVFRGPLTPRPDSGYPGSPPPHQRVLEADFSALSRPGEYQLAVAGLGRSYPFLVDDGIAMGFLRTYALGLFHQRSGMAHSLPFTRFTRSPDHTAPAQVPWPQSDPQFNFTWSKIAEAANRATAERAPQKAPALNSEANQLYPFVRHGAIDVTGGHHDAGDYSRYTINSAWLVHYLVFAADSIQGVAALDNLGIPESGDGIPDVIQEAKYEADFLGKLQDTDGGFYFLVYPKTRAYESNVLPDKGDSLVVWPKNTAVSAAAVAALAQAASSPLFRKHYPAEAARYLRQAQLGWQFLTNAIAKYGKEGAYQKITHYGDNFTHDDELAWAACELFLATGDPQYQEKLFAWFPNPADSATHRWGWWRMSESWGSAIRSYAFAARSGRLPAASLNARYLAICEGEVLAAGDDVVSWSRRSAYGTPFPIETKKVLGGGWYFSLDQASDAAVAYQLDPKPAFIEALVSAMNFEAGTNPLNMSYLAGIGVRRQRETVSQYAQNDRRILPPTGFPNGNIQVWTELHAVSYPTDDGPGGYAPYDRWTDTHNVTTEFITLNLGRAVLATGFLANRTEAAVRPWRAVPARIEGGATAAEVNTAVPLRLEAPGFDLAGARIVWEARDHEPAFGPAFTFTPKAKGQQWIEAEAALPDGRRVFAVTEFGATADVSIWFDGELPAGARPGANGGDSWTFINGTPAPPEGGKVHASSGGPGLHEHFFSEADSPLSIGAGENLFAWVWLDPANPPSQIMLMWNDGGSWEHRAYWGANTITYGQNNSPGRVRLGDLPRAGQWVKLTVPAATVDLAGRTVNGMGFATVNGRALWSTTGTAAK